MVFNFEYWDGIFGYYSTNKIYIEVEKNFWFKIFFWLSTFSQIRNLNREELSFTLFAFSHVLRAEINTLKSE